MPSGPVADEDHARFTALSTSLHMGGFVSIWRSGGWTGGTSTGMVAGACFSFPEEVLLRCYLSSLIGTLRLPDFSLSNMVLTNLIDKDLYRKPSWLILSSCFASSAAAWQCFVSPAGSWTWAFQMLPSVAVGLCLSPRISLCRRQMIFFFLVYINSQQFKEDLLSFSMITWCIEKSGAEKNNSILY